MGKRRGRPPKNPRPETDGAEERYGTMGVQPMDSGLARVNVSLPVAPVRKGVHVAHQLNVRLSGKQAQFFRRVFDGMTQEGVKPRYRSMGLSAPDVVKEIIDRAIDAAE